MTDISNVGASVIRENELETMKLINDLLSSFESSTRARMLNWIIDKNGLRIFNGNKASQDKPIDFNKKF